MTNTYYQCMTLERLMMVNFYASDFISETTLIHRCSPECIQEALSKNLIVRNQRNGVNGYSITPYGREIFR